MPVCVSRLGLMVNTDRELGSSWADSAGYQSSSGSAVLSLRRGDTVSLAVTQGELYEAAARERGYTSLSGFRIG